MPIRDPHDPTGQAILGFVGRRNPTKTDDDFAGPKYLNTRTTPIFTKGEALFGYAEAGERLADDALPVIVEGPIDRSEEHTSELQSLMRISYAVFCLKQKKKM